VYYARANKLGCVAVWLCGCVAVQSMTVLTRFKAQTTARKAAVYHRNDT
jgi:hypothetical protein